MKISNLILSWDFVISIILTLATASALPSYLSLEFCKSFYNVGITVLSIVFSIFFAALAIIMASSDNDFIEFLEEKSSFSNLLLTFKITLVSLFFSLVYSIILYVGTDYYISNLQSKTVFQHKIFFLVFEFLFCYSLIATALSVKDTMIFSKYRNQFLSIKNRKNKAKE